jgi:two-component system NarL family sensor kinase
MNDSSQRQRHDSLRREVLRFVIPAVLGIILLLGASLFAAMNAAREQSIREAESAATWLARSVVTPLLTEDLTSGKVSSIKELDGSLDSSVQGSDVVDVRLWNADGVIIYSNDPRLMGEQFPLPEDISGEIVAEPVDPTQPENRYLDPSQELVQVSLPVAGTDGAEYLFQISQLQDTVQQDARALWLSFAPILVGSVALLGLMLVLLGISMARRINAESESRQALLQHALDSTETERRRIAADLHDGPVQSLAGLSFTLAALSHRASKDGATGDAVALDQAAVRSREAVRELRSLLVDLYPPNLEMSGLAAAIYDHLDGLGPEVTVTADVADLPDLDPHTRAVVYRIAREALTNVEKHSRAEQVSVSLDKEDQEIHLQIVDDGRGFDPSVEKDGHMGLRIIADLAQTSGGRLEVQSTPGSGATVDFRMEQP